MRGDLCEDDVNNCHEDQEEVKLVPATAPVAAPTQPSDLDCSFKNKDGCKGVVAVLFAL